MWLILESACQGKFLPAALKRGEEIVQAAGGPALARHGADLEAEAAFLKRAEEAGRAAVRAGGFYSVGVTAFLKREQRAGWSYSSFKEKRKAFRFKGLAGLADGRWEGQREGGDSDERMLEFARKCYLDASAPTMSYVIRAADEKALQEGWRRWGGTKVREYLARIPKAERVYKREGEEAFRNQCGTYIERTSKHLRSNDIWQSDHMRADVMCFVKNKVDYHTGEETPIYDRPWLSSIIDVRSRKILAHEVRVIDPDSGVILLVFHRAASGEGLPEVFYTDCGKDYDHRDFTGETKAERRKRRRENPNQEDPPKGGIWERLGIAQQHALPYNARAKLIERWHRTVHEQFDTTWDTYTGSTTDSKPERLAEEVKKAHAPTVAQYAAAFAEWVRIYNATPHHGEGMGGKSPDEVYAENLEKKRVMPREQLDFEFLRRVGPVKVGRNGVRYHKLNYGQYDLGFLQGQEVYLRVDDADLTKVSVWDLADRKFLGFAKANRQIPTRADRTLLREAIAEQRR